MKKLLAIALILVSQPAEARRHHGAHCRLGQLYRVSMGKCVSASSALGREIRPIRVSLRYRRLTRYAEKNRPEEAEADYYVDILLPHDGSLSKDKDEDLPNPDWPRGWDNWPPKSERGSDWHQ